MADNNIRVDADIKNPALSEYLGMRIAIGGNEKPDEKAVNENLEKIVAEIVERAMFLVPAELENEPIKDKDGKLSVPAASAISFVVFSDGNGKKYIPIFSDMEQVARWDKASNIHMFTMDFEQVISILSQMGGEEGLVLNPYSDNLMMKRSMVMKWHEQLQISRKGHASHAISTDMADKAYALNPYPFQLMNTLCAAARENEKINAMWLRGIKLNDEHSYLLVVDFTGDRQAALSPLGEAAKKYLGDKPLHIVPKDDGFGGKVVEGITPIYTKS